MPWLGDKGSREACGEVGWENMHFVLRLLICFHFISATYKPSSGYLRKKGTCVVFFY